MRTALAALLGIVAALVINFVDAHAQVNPVYSQDPVTGNATQQQKVTVPVGQTWTCLGTCTGGAAGSVPVTGITGLGTGVATALQAATNTTGGMMLFGGVGMLSSLALSGATIGSNQIAGTGFSVDNSGDITGVQGIFSSSINTGGIYGFGSNQSVFGNVSNGVVSWTNYSNSAGAALDVSTDGTAKFRNRANSADATVTALTQSPGDNTNKVATTAFVTAAAAAGLPYHACVYWTGGGTTIVRNQNDSAGYSVSSITRSGAGGYTVNGTFPSNAEWVIGISAASGLISMLLNTASTTAAPLISFNLAGTQADAANYWACVR